MRKRLKLSSGGGDSGSKKCKRDMGAPEVGSGGVCVWREYRVWSQESGSPFCVGAFGRNLASVAVKMFSHLIYFIKTFYNFCAFSVICKDNAAISCITVQHKKGFIRVNFDGHTTLVNLIIDVMMKYSLDHAVGQC
jgi:hypothetical protein